MKFMFDIFSFFCYNFSKLPLVKPTGRVLAPIPKTPATCHLRPDHNFMQIQLLCINRQAQAQATATATVNCSNYSKI